MKVLALCSLSLLAALWVTPAQGAIEPYGLWLCFEENASGDCIDWEDAVYFHKSTRDCVGGHPYNGYCTVYVAREFVGAYDVYQIYGVVDVDSPGVTSRRVSYWDIDGSPVDFESSVDTVYNYSDYYVGWEINDLNDGPWDYAHFTPVFRFDFVKYGLMGESIEIWTDTVY